MKAMILAAGLGTRLKPFTDTIPKALVEMRGKPMLAHVIERLKLFGVESIVVNMHYLAERIEEYLASHDFGIPISTIHETEILETAGGIVNARKLLQDKHPILVHNVDIISTIDIKEMYDFHCRQNAFATVAVRKPANTRPFLVDSRRLVVGHRNKLTGKEIVLPDARGFEEHNFCGIHVLSQECLDSLVSGATRGVSMTTAYLDLIWKGKNVHAFDVGEASWYDIGSIEKLRLAEDNLT